MSQYRDLIDILQKTGDGASELLLRAVGTEDANPQWLTRLRDRGASGTLSDIARETHNAFRPLITSLAVHGALLQRLTQQVLSYQKADLRGVGRVMAVPKMVGESVARVLGRDRTGGALEKIGKWWRGGDVIGKPTARDVMLYGERGARARLPRTPGARDSAAIRGLGQAAKIAGRVFAGLAIAGGIAKLLGGFANRQVESQRFTSRFAGDSAGAYARLDYQQTLRDIRVSQATSASTVKMVESVNAMRESQLPADIFARNFMNEGASWAASIKSGATDLAMAVGSVIDVTGMVADAIKEAKRAAAEADDQMFNSFHDALMRNENRAARRQQLPPVV